MPPVGDGEPDLGGCHPAVTVTDPDERTCDTSGSDVARPLIARNRIQLGHHHDVTVDLDELNGRAQRWSELVGSRADQVVPQLDRIGELDDLEATLLIHPEYEQSTVRVGKRRQGLHHGLGQDRPTGRRLGLDLVALPTSP